MLDKITHSQVYTQLTKKELDKMNQFEPHTITKSEFMKLNEDDLMFITNPGRMGDVDGSTFIVKQGNELTIYRVDGWMSRRMGEEDISLEDARKQFPKWHEAWQHSKEDNYQGKYQYLYMGFGNGLSVDHSIYSEFEPYLDKLVEKYLEENASEDKESLRYAAIFHVWEQAVIQMANEKGMVFVK